jgi:hypothetical protein
VGHHHRLGFWADGGFERGDVNVVGGNGAIDENRNGAPKDRGIDGGRKAGDAGDDLVARLDLTAFSRGEVSAEKATRLADEPELTVSAERTPIRAASFCSKSSLKRPVVSQKSSAESTRNCISRAP